MSEISKEEVALYDRQIRLWGMEAQNRLRTSTVCFIGISALTLEACKNLVLAGIGTLILQDPAPITQRDLEVQYYFQSSDLDKPKDQVLAERLAILNPLVKIRVEGHKDPKCDVLIVVGTGNIREVEYTTKFIAADSFGLFGYVFVDCLDGYEFVEQVKGEDGEMQTRLCKAEYKRLSQSLQSSIEGTNVQRLKRKYPSLAFIVQALMELTSKQQKISNAILIKAVGQMLDSRGIPRELVDEATISRVVQSWDTEFVPCAAVVGGALAQEVLKIVTCKDMPIQNWYTYDALRGDGITCFL
ncbi:E1 ubiquitin-activating protein aos1 [Coemansia brasiliensis]|uniref:E1 ubiquitin-activating protein aos1 n=1 Tax=Coemansia brasiliensis TaxID=2650707 RepID=A0A9W8IH10_9FUNG|nr:E1 ubiquitin-activating protein aos1 [Coemansia brasiliensis]